MLQDSRFRFLVVGGVNFLIDTGILLALSYAGLALLPANIISTSIALTISFLVNRRFTFRADGSKPMWLQAVQFLGVTLFGLWVLQPPVIALINRLIDSYIPYYEIPFAGSFLDVPLLAGKVVATVVTLVWNYLLYSRFVFKPSNRT